MKSFLTIGLCLLLMPAAAEVPQELSYFFKECETYRNHIQIRGTIFVQNLSEARKHALKLENPKITTADNYLTLCDEVIVGLQRKSCHETYINVSTDALTSVSTGREEIYSDAQRACIVQTHGSLDRDNAYSISTPQQAMEVVTQSDSPANYLFRAWLLPTGKAYTWTSDLSNPVLHKYRLVYHLPTGETIPYAELQFSPRHKNLVSFTTFALTDGRTFPLVTQNNEYKNVDDNWPVKSTVVEMSSDDLLTTALVVTAKFDRILTADLPRLPEQAGFPMALEPHAKVYDHRVKRMVAFSELR